MTPIKEEVIALLNRLPDDASLEDIQYHLFVIEKVRNGLDSIEKEGGLTQEQVEARLSKWLV
jgi:hypothetical protein